MLYQQLFGTEFCVRLHCSHDVRYGVDCRHFLACCSRILNITSAIVKRGYIQLMLSGRSVNLLSVHPGIEPLVVQKALDDFKPKPEATDKIIILAIDSAKVTFSVV